MRTVIFAYHDIGCMAIQTLHEMGEKICAVFTHADDANENVWFGSVEKCAQSLGIPVFAPPNPNTPEWIKKIEAMRPEIIFSFYYRKLICDAILTIPPKGGLNLHGSLLPKYRGRAPVNWVLVHGEKETGLTLHYMIAKPDAGEIVAQKKVSVAEADTALTLYKKLVPLTREILMETIPLLAKGTAAKIPQDETKASYFGGRKPEDGKIDWKKSSREIYNLVRAVTHPYPGAFTFSEGKKTFIWQSELKEYRRPKSQGSGMIISATPFIVSCMQGSLVIQQIQTENEQELSGEDWVIKNSVQIGTLLGGE